MQSYSTLDIILVRYPFSDLSASKIRPAIIVNPQYPSQDLLIVPLTSNTQNLLPGEFVLANWKRSGLKVATAVKRGIYTIDKNIVVKRIGKIVPPDARILEKSLKLWLGL